MVAQRALYLCVLLLAGCHFLNYQPTFDPATREAVRRALPSDIALETIAERPSKEEIITVEDMLLRVRARVDEKGTLRDSSGKKIHFIREAFPTEGYHRPAPPPPSPEELQERAERAERDKKLFQECTVIFITGNPNLMPFPP